VIQVLPVTPWAGRRLLRCWHRPHLLRCHPAAAAAAAAAESQEEPYYCYCYWW
jgi:hypothetical protein